MSPDFLRMPQEIKDYLNQANSGNIHQEDINSLKRLNKTNFFINGTL